MFFPFADWRTTPLWVIPLDGFSSDTTTVTFTFSLEYSPNVRMLRRFAPAESVFSNDTLST